MWAWRVRPPAAVGEALRALRARAWRGLDTPAALADGVLEPGLPNVWRMPSPYDIPDGVRVARCGEAWGLALRYLDNGEAGRWRRVGGGWAHQGRHSGRLQALAGGAAATPEGVMAAWLGPEVGDPCSHPAILRTLVAEGMFEEYAWR